MDSQKPNDEQTLRPQDGTAPQDGADCEVAKKKSTRSSSKRSKKWRETMGWPTMPPGEEPIYDPFQEEEDAKEAAREAAERERRERLIKEASAKRRAAVRERRAQRGPKESVPWEDLTEDIDSDEELLVDVPEDPAVRDARLLARYRLRHPKGASEDSPGPAGVPEVPGGQQERAHAIEKGGSNSTTGKSQGKTAAAAVPVAVGRKLSTVSEKDKSVVVVRQLREPVPKYDWEEAGEHSPVAPSPTERSVRRTEPYSAVRPSPGAKIIREAVEGGTKLRLPKAITSPFLSKPSPAPKSTPLKRESPASKEEKESPTPQKKPSLRTPQASRIPQPPPRQSAAMRTFDVPLSHKSVKKEDRVPKASPASANPKGTLRTTSKVKSQQLKTASLLAKPSGKGVKK